MNRHQRNVPPPPPRPSPSAIRRTPPPPPPRPQSRQLGQGQSASNDINASNKPPRDFKRHFLLAFLSLVALQFAILLILHSEPFDYESTITFVESTPFDTKVPKARRVGIGSKHFHGIAHKNNVSSECHSVASDAVLEEWKNGKQTVCSIGSTESEEHNVLIEEYVLRSWEYEPTLVRCQVK
eukprot:scaffold133581_cov53-Cyclotella_meneghiniana.AAC.1